MNNTVKMAAFDTSTKKSGCSLFVDGKYQKHELLDFSHLRDVNDRIDEMGKSLITLLFKWEPTMVFIETPRGDGRNVELVRKLSEILGIVRGWCIMNDAYYEEVLPSVWRKYIGIQQGKKKRDELKAESVGFVKNTYGLDVNDDVADSICLGGAMVNKYKENGKHDKRKNSQTVL